jgi:hypothetical protein
LNGSNVIAFAASLMSISSIAKRVSGLSIP